MLLSASPGWRAPSGVFASLQSFTPPALYGLIVSPTEMTGRNVHSFSKDFEMERREAGVLEHEFAICTLTQALYEWTRNECICIVWDCCMWMHLRMRPWDSCEDSCGIWWFLCLCVSGNAGGGSAWAWRANSKSICFLFCHSKSLPFKFMFVLFVFFSLSPPRASWSLALFIVISVDK